MSLLPQRGGQGKWCSSPPSAPCVGGAKSAGTEKEAVKGVAVFETHQMQGREAGEQNCHVEGPEQAGGTGQQEPHGVEQHRVVHVGQPSVHVGMCSLGLDGQQPCRKGPALPMDNKCKLAVRLCSDEGKLGCISTL